jgi:cardiolipin synthase
MSSVEQPAARAPAPAAEPFDYALSTQGMTRGNATRLLPGGAEAFPNMLLAIAAAESEVLLESYTIADDATGRSFLDALAAAAQRGVDVRLICDAFGSLSLPSSRLDALEAAGVKTLVYRPLAPWRPHWGLVHRDHRKILVVDRKIGFCGGLNLADDYDERTQIGRYWRDLHLRVEGPAVHSFAALFVKTWNQHCPPPRQMRAARTLTKVAAIPAVHAGGVAVQVVGNRETRHRSLIRRSFLFAAKHARRSIWIANPYFIPDRAVSRALIRAVARGVEVRVLVPARSDVLLVDLAARHAFGALLAAGVRIAEWSLGMMHAKAAAVDGAWATVGSYNLDRRSLRYNLEVTANVFDRGFAEALERHVGADFTRSTELRADSFARRPWWQRLLSWTCYLARSWL